MSAVSQRLVASHERRCQRERILRKLETLWAAKPDATLGDVLLGAMCQFAPYDMDIGHFTPDAEVEAALDGALAANGLTVAGGWKS